MSVADLSVLIPARNEMWLNRTVADVLAHATADTEIIVVLDGCWPDEPLPQHPKLQVVYLPTAIGQRAATNLAARISTARYLMKLDAHCAVAPGFDTALMEAAAELGPAVVQIPAQHNLHVFDWVCDGCGKRTYQGPTPTNPCDHCEGTAYHRDVVWRRRRGVRTTAWRFDAELHFQYWGDLQARPEGTGELTETMSCLGACWFLARDRYWQWGGLDEAHGSWGQMGTEIACKAWLSGGRLVCNQRTWFAHLFRTQGGDFGFPYPLKGSEQEAARRHSRRLWLEEGWPGAVQPLSWLLAHFAPVPGWDPAAVRAAAAPSSAAVHTGATAGVIYYSDCRPDPALLETCRTQLVHAAAGLPIVSCTLAPVALGHNLVLPLERGPLTMAIQILTALEALDTDLVFHAEHDVLYHPSHFAFRPSLGRTYHYNQHTWKVDAADGKALHYRCNQLSGLVAPRLLLVDHYRARVDRISKLGWTTSIGFEPGTHKTPRGIDDHPHATWWSEGPNIDIRHGHNLTRSRWSPDQFRNPKYCQGWQLADAVPGWGVTKDRFAAFLAEVVPGPQKGL